MPPSETAPTHGSRGGSLRQREEYAAPTESEARQPRRSRDGYYYRPVGDEPRYHITGAWTTAATLSKPLNASYHNMFPLGRYYQRTGGAFQPSSRVTAA